MMVEIYRIKNNLNRQIMDFMFERRNNTYHFGNIHECTTKRKRTVKI